MKTLLYIFIIIMALQAIINRTRREGMMSAEELMLQLQEEELTGGGDYADESEGESEYADESESESEYADESESE